MTTRNALPLLAVALAALGAAGCGIKGPLTLPEKTENVVIRAPGAQGTTTEGATATPGSEPPSTEQAPAQRDRMPPPPLPSSNPGTGHGG